MEYIVEKDKIIIKTIEDFDPQHILECGQIFSYQKCDENYVVYSANQMATIKNYGSYYEILTTNPKYFVNFFDLNTNYSDLKKQLKNSHNFLNSAINFGRGIRILNQDPFETIISFIVSANNNIKRIQKILFKIREQFGTNMGKFHAFPTISQLKTASVQDFIAMGAGYRAKYLYQAVRQLENENLQALALLSTEELNKKLLGIMGVGQKVADCIMLFAFGKKDVFPVDTWIEKVYNEYFEKETNRKTIRQNLLKIFGKNAGYAQQYLFYSQRSDKN